MWNLNHHKLILKCILLRNYFPNMTQEVNKVVISGGNILNSVKKNQPTAKLSIYFFKGGG